MNDLPRILLVEDDPKDVALTLKALERFNLANEVTVARDGVEALDFLFCRGNYSRRPPGNPAVVLLDLKLPKMDGLEVLRILRGTEALRMIPVVILTSSGEDRDRIEGYRLGTNAYVVKPVHFATFMESVACLGGFWAIVNAPPPGSFPNFGALARRPSNPQ